MRFVVNAVTVQVVVTHGFQQRHRECDRPGDLITGGRFSPDILPGAKVDRHCGLCMRPIPLLK